MKYIIKEIEFSCETINIKTKCRVNEKISMIMKNNNHSDMFEKTLNKYREEDYEKIFTGIAKSCVYYGRMEYLEILMNKIPYDINFENGILILIAVYFMHDNIVKFLIDKKINIDMYLDNLFPIACYRLNIYLIKLLISKGCNINYGNGYILHQACTYGKEDFVKYLIELGMDPNCKSKQNDTPCTLALKNDREDIAKYLFSVGANYYHDDNLFKSAIEGKCFDTIKFLLDNGADPNANFCPLLLSIYTSDFDIMKLLIEYGADISVIGKEKIDVNDSDWKIAQYLLEKNIDPIQVIKLMINEEKHNYL